MRIECSLCWRSTSPGEHGMMCIRRLDDARYGTTSSLCPEWGASKTQLKHNLIERGHRRHCLSPSPSSPMNSSLLSQPARFVVQQTRFSSPYAALLRMAEPVVLGVYGPRFRRQLSSCNPLPRYRKPRV